MPAEVCVRDVARSVRVADGPIHLAAERSDAELAARLGHLLLHVREGLPQLTPGAGCDADLERALAAEVHAHALERRLRAALGAPPLPADALTSVQAQLKASCE